MLKLNPVEVHALLKAAEENFPHEACRACECFHGYVAQLRVDADAHSKEIFAEYAVKRGEMHGCLGCDPCPPGNLYAEYIKRKQGGISLNVLA